ncbi:hypothetical protein [Haloarcula amylovorans]|uniref:hypothetical protein n=1 Tax=Haloarcula amylovorans TaxID=2562280 RepID=UPI001076ADF6|nr:hypothetical protein [Halomicroarcula amylolytica]
MSSNEETPEAMAEESMEKAGGLGEVIPEPLMPAWRQVERVQSFRETHGDKYVAALEVLTAIALTGGYIWWVYLFLLGGSGSPI